MRIMVLGDTHGNARFVEAAILLAESMQCEIIYVVGDFGIWDHTKAGIEFLDFVNKSAKLHGITIFFCDGNHENFDSLYSIPVESNGLRVVRDSIIHTPRGHIWQWGDVRFMAMGGAHSIDGPDGADWWQQARGPITLRGVETDLGSWWPQETITEEDVKAAQENVDTLGTVDVVLSHDLPWGVDLPEGWDDYPAGTANRKMLRRAVDIAKPELVVHGHMHTHWKHSVDFGYGELQVVGLAHDGGIGQYMYIETEPFNFIVPDFSN